MIKSASFPLPEIKRGEIFMADLGRTTGYEAGGLLKVLVLSNDKGNRFSRLVVVAPIMKESKRKKPLPVHIGIVEEGKEEEEVIFLEQIRTIDKSRLKKLIGEIDPLIVPVIDNGIKVALGIYPAA